MEPKYIFAVAALSLFCVLFLIFFVLLARRRKKEAELQAYLSEVYSDKNLVKFDYDSVDEDSEPQPANNEKSGEKSSADVKEEARPKQESTPIIEEMYGKIENEGIEEITGTYNPK